MFRRLALIILSLFFAVGCNLKDDGQPAVDAGNDGATGECADGELCGEACVDTQTSVEHCGACDTSCVDDPRNNECVDVSCAAGACEFEPIAGGSCTTEADEPGQCLDGACVECTSDEDCVDTPSRHTVCWAASCTDDNICDYTVPDPNVVCGEPTCSDGLFKEPDLCGDRGSCNLRDPGTECAPYECNEAGDACETTCEADDDCVGGARCIASECQQTLIVDLQIDADQQDVVLTEELSSRTNWNGLVPVEGSIRIAPGVVIGASSAADPAFRIDALPDTSSITLVNDGRIVGRGGAGAGVTGSGQNPSGFVPAGDGGPGLLVESQSSSVSVSVDNRGIIGGGGGGGGAGYSNVFGDIYISMAGGGGAGNTPGAGGDVADSIANGNDGNPGTTTEPGTPGQFGDTRGGRGGALGEPGDASNANSKSLPGGAGVAIIGETNLTWTAEGDIRGIQLP